MVLAMVKVLVDYPDEIVVNASRSKHFVAFEVICHEQDAGTLIGTRGKHANAMRTLLMAAGTMRHTRISLQFISRDHDSLPAR